MCALSLYSRSLIVPSEAICSAAFSSRLSKFESRRTLFNMINLNGTRKGKLRYESFNNSD